jgi:hypothetical protein
MKPKEFYLKIDVWKSGCWIVWPVDKNSAKEWFKTKLGGEYNFENLEYKAEACAVLGSIPAIFLTKWDNSPEWIANLTHECIHIANFILQRCDVKEKEGCDEALAYLVGYLLEEFLKVLKKKR